MKALMLIAMLLPGLGSCGGSAFEEVGQVAWQRDFEAALVQAKTDDKPVFLLFQEVPGCAGCKQFGKEVLSDPRLVEVIESEFIPVLVRNNVGGEEADILKRYNEPAWNYQVVRFLNAEGKDLIPRKDRVWETEALAKRMKAALTKCRKPTPARLQGIIDGVPEAEAVFAMRCFWTGEAKLGGLDGVTTTEAGFFDGREVVRVRYDPSEITISRLKAEASKLDCAEKVYLPDPRKVEELEPGVGKFDAQGYRKAPSSDQKRQLRGTHLDKVDLSDAQATKVNAYIRKDARRAMGYLTDEQKAELSERR